MSLLVGKLRSDLAQFEARLLAIGEEKRSLEERIGYIRTLLQSAAGEVELAENENSTSTSSKYAGKTIAEVAIEILSEDGESMPCIEIARRAMAGGFDAPNIERARSHFSAVISKDINGQKPRFWQAGRGLIGLAEWQGRDQEELLIDLDIEPVELVEEPQLMENPFAPEVEPHIDDSEISLLAENLVADPVPDLPDLD